LNGKIFPFMSRRQVFLFWTVTQWALPCLPSRDLLFPFSKRFSFLVGCWGSSFTFIFRQAELILGALLPGKFCVLGTLYCNLGTLMANSNHVENLLQLEEKCRLPRAITTPRRIRI
jgi:hypothetical protein